MIDLKHVYEKALTYGDYRKRVDELAANGKTTGNTQSEAYLGFTKLNIQRMNRLDKSIEIEENILESSDSENKKQLWLLIGDAWCGDCAQIIPIVNKIALTQPKKIEFRIISRDEFPELIKSYQTNGSNSIPKLLILDGDNYRVLNTWGPRPEGANKILLHWKANINTMTKEDFEKELHLWYARDRGQGIIKEIINIVNLQETHLS